MHVWLIKPRPTSATARSLCAAVSVWRPCEVVPPHSDIYELYRSREKTDVIIVDECHRAVLPTIRHGARFSNTSAPPSKSA